MTTARQYWEALRLMLRGNLKSPYRFSLADAALHNKERAWKTPLCRVVEEGELNLLEIDGRRFFWPRAFDAKGLSWLYGEVFFPFAGNPASYDHPRASIPKGGWVIDGGACEGFFTLFALERGAGRVLACEPVPALARALRETVCLHEATARADVVEAALGKTRGRENLAAPEGGIWEAALDAKQGNVSVAVETIDELARARRLEGPGFIKMDVEGAEMKALEGARRLLASAKPALAVAVYHGLDNAHLCRDIVLGANRSYRTEFRGLYGWYEPPRPYMLYAW
jgi:FkbM family methyltransferase